MSEDAPLPSATPAPSETASAAPAPAPAGKRRSWLRFGLLVVIPVLAAVGGTEVYLNGGRYISTDNAYVGAQKVLITPEVSGTVDQISVREGQSLKAGDVLFTIDRKPYEIALDQAQAALSKAENDYNTYKTRLQAWRASLRSPMIRWHSARANSTASPNC